MPAGHAGRSRQELPAPIGVYPIGHIVKLLLVMLAAFALHAADLSGKWSGTSEYTNRDGESRSVPMTMTLKQAGDTVTGTVGPGPDRQQEIRNGKLSAGKLTFEITDPAGSAEIELSVSDNALTGQAKMKREYGVIAMKLSLKRD